MVNKLFASSSPAESMWFKFYEIESSNDVGYTLVSKTAILDFRDIGPVKRISQNMLMEGGPARLLSHGVYTDAWNDNLTYTRPAQTRRAKC